MSISNFLSTLLHDKPDKLYVLIWEKTPTTKISSWFRSYQDIAAIQPLPQHDIYIGCGLSAQDYGRYERCKAHQIAGIPGIWLDVDITHAKAHKKVNLVPDEQTAMNFVAKFPLEPSIIVNSGHGLQLWWVFEKFWSFDSHAMRERAAKMMHQFNSMMKRYANSIEYDIDATQDLSRVFRLPDTTNWKYSPVPVTLKSYSEKRYSLLEITKTIDELTLSLAIKEEEIDSSPRATASELSGPIPFIIDPQAMPPPLKFQVMMENEPRFKASWNAKRKDFADQSPSSYDFSLGTFALLADWSWQETVDLLIAFRRERKFESKLRADYYNRTLTNIQNTIKKNAAIDAIDDVLLKVNTTENKEEICQNISTLLGVKINRIVKYCMDPPEYRLETPSGSVHLGNIQNLIEQTPLRRKIADATRHMITPMKAAQWNRIAQALLDACVEEDAGGESTNIGIVRTWLSLYLQYSEPMYDPNTAQLAHRPFFKDGALHLFGPDLRQFLVTYHKEMVTTKDMGLKLKEYGFSSASLSFKRDDNSSRLMTRWVWRITIKDPIVSQFLEQITVVPQEEQDGDSSYALH